MSPHRYRRFGRSRLGGAAEEDGRQAFLEEDGRQAFLLEGIVSAVGRGAVLE